MPTTKSTKMHTKFGRTMNIEHIYNTVFGMKTLTNAFKLMHALLSDEWISKTDLFKSTVTAQHENNLE